MFWQYAILGRGDIQLPQICHKMWTFVKNIGKENSHNGLIINNIHSNPFHPIPFAPYYQPDEIWYTSTDGKIVTPYDPDAFDVAIVSNTYENGKGVIKFDGNLTSIGKSAFKAKTNLSSVMIPHKVTSINDSAFGSCTNLMNIYCKPSIPPSIYLSSINPD